MKLHSQWNSEETVLELVKSRLPSRSSLYAAYQKHSIACFICCPTTYATSSSASQIIFFMTENQSAVQLKYELSFCWSKKRFHFSTLDTNLIETFPFY